MIRQENLTKIYIKTAHSNSPEGWRFTSRQPMSSGATTSAGRQKKEWGRCWEGVVAIGVARGMGGCAEAILLPTPKLTSQPRCCSSLQQCGSNIFEIFVSGAPRPPQPDAGKHCRTGTGITASCHQTCSGSGGTRSSSSRPRGDHH